MKGSAGLCGLKIVRMKKLTEKQICARIAMYDEAISALDAYESADEEERVYEKVQKLVVIRQLELLKNRFVAALSNV